MEHYTYYSNGQRITRLIHNPPIDTGWDTDLFLGCIDKVKCSICWCVYRDASTLSCGHTFCFSCINTQKQCALCLQPTTDIAPDYAKRQYIMGLKVKCSHQDCLVTGSLRAMKDHEKICLNRYETCVQCKLIVKSKYFERHWKEECGHRIVSCKTCDQTYRKSNVHLCPLEESPCGSCDWKGIRSEKTKHDQECPHHIISCPLFKYGCLYQGKRHTLIQHMETVDHMVMMSVSIEERLNKMGIGL